MRSCDYRTRRSKRSGANRLDRPLRRSWRRASTGLAAIAFLACTAALGQQAPSTNPGKQQVTAESNQKKQSVEETFADRNKQIVEDSAQLLKLATDLKAEIDKTTLDTLSLKVIRDADVIGKLAHNLRKKIQTPGGPAL